MAHDKHDHDHDHDHDHEHEHEHEHTHDHGHTHGHGTDHDAKHGHEHSHDHDQDHAHVHGHDHAHHHGGSAYPPPVQPASTAGGAPAPAASAAPQAGPAAGARLIVLRTPSGLSGDMLVAGLATLAEATDADLATLLSALHLPALEGSVQVRPHALNQISGWKAQVQLPTEHAHRTFGDIAGLFERSALTPAAQALAIRTFRILAEAEARVHGIKVSRVAFHEVGALDSILDIGLASALYTGIGASALHCSPLPLCDGTIRCEHGLLASPAPAVQEMLVGVPVYGIASRGETVTPTALAFLRGVDAVFGPWPAMRVGRCARVYGGRVLPQVPNGAIFTLGTAL